MESIIIWSVAALIAAVIILPYFLRFRKIQQENISRKSEAKKLGIDRPNAQFPFIDESRCIGCGSCIIACPEGDVIGVIFGKATVINGIRCVGHGLCEPACPVGAIEVGLGDIKSRPDIPHLDENLQSNVPGLYVVGELGGLSLIRNAIDQGQRAVRHLAKHLNGDNSRDADLLIIGAGPAGLTAALTAHQMNIHFQIIDQQDAGGTILQYPRKKLVMTQPVDLPYYGRLDKSEYQKEELLDIWYRLIKKHQIDVKTGVRVLKIISRENEFSVETTSGSFHPKKIILAMGRRGTPRKLNVPGEDLPKVAYQLVDAQSYQKKNIVVVGGGDSAIEAAVGLARQKGNKVTISYRKSNFFRIKKKNEDNITQMLRQKKMKVVFNSQLEEISEDAVRLRSDSGSTQIKNDFVFIFAGGIPPFEMLKEAGIRFGDSNG